MEQQAVIVHFLYGSTDLSRLFALEERVEQVIKDAGVGEFDGDEIRTDGHDGVLFMYGPSADRLFAVVLPVLRTADFMEGAKITRRYGPAAQDAREVVDIVKRAQH